MHYEFRYRLRRDVPSLIFSRWRHLKKTLNTEIVQNSLIKHVKTKDDDIVFQVVGKKSMDTKDLVTIRDKLQKVFMSHMQTNGVHCCLCFMEDGRELESSRDIV